MRDYIRSLRNGLLINGLILLDWVFVFWILGSIYNYLGSDLFMWLALIITLFVLLLIVIIPINFAISMRKSSCGFGKMASMLFMSFIFSVLFFILFLLLVMLTFPKTAEAMGFAGFPIIVMLSFIIGHLFGFAYCLIKYFRGKKLSTNSKT